MPWLHYILRLSLQTIFIHFHSSPFLTILHLMRHTAPVFRHACPEPVSQFPNLPNMFLEPGFYRRYFAAIDVLLSVTSARPMLFRYDVTCPPSFFNQEYPLEYGLEWAHGTPDQFIVLFAWINGLVEDSLANGVAVDPECVARIEDQVKNGTHVRDFPNSDPVLRIGRVVVREYWRQAVLVYLYMVSRCASRCLGRQARILIGFMGRHCAGLTRKTPALKEHSNGP